MKQSEIFYFDVDGTLLDNETSTIPQSTIDALNALQAKGYKIALCTGRTFFGIKEVKVDNLVDWDGYVLANGGLVLDKDQNVIHESYFSPEFIHNLIDKHPEALLLEGDELFVTGTLNQRILDSFEHFDIQEMYPQRDYNNEKIYNIMSYAFDSLDQSTQDQLNKEAQIVYDRLGNREIMTRDSGKQNGVKVLNKHLGFDRYAGFGDAENDIEFLRNAHFAVAMGNGIDKVKQVAHYTTDSVLNNGIWRALVQYGILEDNA